MSYSNIINTSEIDKYLTGNPQITFFKSVYRRHTPFYKGVYTYPTRDDVFGKNIKEEISKSSFDLITNIYLENRIIGITGATKIGPNLGNTIIDNISLNTDLNTQLFQTYGLYMEARAELDHPYVSNKKGTKTCPPIIDNHNGSFTCNNGSQYNILTMAGGVSGSNTPLTSIASTDIFYTYPDFYFSKDYGNSFPLCALNNNKIILNIQYRNREKVINDSSSTLTSTVNIEYVDLTDDERKRFINNTEHYIYYDILKISLTNSTDIINHPLRQFFIMGSPTNHALSCSYSESTPISIKDTGITDIKVSFNESDLLESSVDNIAHFTKHNIGKLYQGYGRELGDGSKSLGYTDSIGVIDFCLDTTNTPSGHISANTRFLIKTTPSTNNNNITIFAEVIKFYKIMGGQIGLLYV